MPASARLAAAELEIVRGLEAQTGAIEGTVTDSTSGEPLPGVNVVIEGTQQGASADAEGNYRIEGVETGTYDVQASFVGYATELVESVNVQDGETTTVNFALQPSTVALDEVVAVGYGTQQRQDLTGAVSSISTEELEAVPVTSVDQALKGRVAGVQVTQGSAAPGGGVSVRIRGGNSILSGGEPLYVIDGFPVYSDNQTASIPGAGDARRGNQNVLATLDPSSIESIQVLKDASATAIYGSRGANGVVLITTKNGRAGQETRVSYNAYAGMQEVRRMIPMINARQWAEMYNEALRLQGEDPLWGFEEGYASPEELGAGTNWQEALFRPASMMNHQLTVSGGSQETQFAISGGYFDQDGIIIGTAFERASVRANLETEATEWLRTGAHLTFSHSISELGQTEHDNTVGGAGLVGGALLSSPIFSIYRPDGTFTNPGQDPQLPGTGRFRNPIAEATLSKDIDRRNRFLGDAFAELDLLEGLSLRVSLGADLQDGRREVYYPRGTSAGDNNGGLASHGSRRIVSWLNENTLNYKTEINDIHRFDLVAGFTQQGLINTLDFTQSSGFVNDNLEDDLDAGTVPSIPRSDKTKWTLASWLGRANYSLYDKYLLTLTARADGSSRFGSGNKWGFFPAAAVGWKLSEEPFVEQLGLFSNLKLRTSYGITGNAEIPLYQSLARLGLKGYTFNGAKAVGFAPTNVPNPELKWETTSMLNIGLDMAFLDSRLRLTTNYYYNRTNDMLLRQTIPFSSGFGTLFRNVGSLKNEGLELGLEANLFMERDFMWSMAANWSMNRNKILDIGDSDPFFTGDVRSFRIGVPGTFIQEGIPLGLFYDLEVIGIIRTQEQLENMPLRTQGGSPRGQNLGDLLFRDVNGDGTITGADQTSVGNANPDFIFSWSNNFYYKNFDLGVFINGVYGNEIVNSAVARLESGWPTTANQTQRAYEERWHPEKNPDGTRIRAAVNRTTWGANVSRIEDGSFLRVRDVTLGYTIPSNSVFQSARVYLSGQNLITLTSYYGYDPEVSAFGQSNILRGVDLGSYPTAKSYTLGVNLTF